MHLTTTFYCLFKPKAASFADITHHVISDSSLGMAVGSCVGIKDENRLTGWIRGDEGSLVLTGYLAVNDRENT